MRLRQAAHRIDEVAVLAIDRIVFGLPDRPSAADIDHDLAVGQLDRQAVAEQMQADAMAPPQQACGRQLADSASGKAKGDRRGGRDVEAGKIVARRECARLCIDLGNLPDQMAREIDDVRGLLDDLPAGLILAPPPTRRRRLVEPVAGDQAGRIAGEQTARFLDRIEIAPMIADAGDEPALLDRRRAIASAVARSSESGFSTKKGSPAAMTRRSGSPCAKGGTQI